LYEKEVFQYKIRTTEIDNNILSIQNDDMTIFRVKVSEEITELAFTMISKLTDIIIVF